MKTTESISNLFNLGVQNVNIGPVPQGQGIPGFYMNCKQVVPRGEMGNAVVCDHQVVSGTIGECLTKLTEAVEKTHALKIDPSGIVKLPTQRLN